MKSIPGLLLVFALGTGATSPSLAAEATVAAAFVDSLVKVFPDSPLPPPGEPPLIAMARNGHASLQLALRSESPARVAVRVSPPTRERATLEAEIYRVGYVRVKSHPTDTPPDEVVRPEVGLYPDPLFPMDGELALEPAHTGAIWISVYAPAGTAPGIYVGEIEVETAGRSSRLPVRVEVFAATVPKEQTLRVTNWLWLERELIEKHYPKVKEDPDRYWTVMANLAKTMAAYRQNVALVPVRTLATAHLDGDRIRYDFSLVDRWIEIFDRAGLARVIEGGHLSGRLGGGYDAPYVLATDFIANGRVVRAELPADDPRAEANLREFLRQLYTHLKQRGWLSRYVQHIHDEPHGPEMPVYRRFGRIVREEMPGVPTIDAISLKENLADQEGTTIWVPLLGTFDDKLDALAAHRTHGGQTWYYICLHPRGRYLNRFVDFPLLKVRLLPWLNFRYGLTGFLHWGGTYWTDHPFDDLQPAWGDNFVLPAGDDAIVYPDPARDGVFVSTRLEIMREGIEDYEMLAVAAKTAPGQAAALARSAVPGFTDYVRGVGRFRQLERELLQLASAAAAR